MNDKSEKDEYDFDSNSIEEIKAQTISLANSNNSK